MAQNGSRTPFGDRGASIQQDTRLDMIRTMAWEASLWRQHSTASGHRCRAQFSVSPEVITDTVSRSTTELVRSNPHRAQCIVYAFEDRLNQTNPNVYGNNAILQCGLSCPERKEWSTDEKYVVTHMTRARLGDSCADIMLHFDSSCAYGKSQDFKNIDDEHGKELAGHVDVQSGSLPSHAVGQDTKEQSIEKRKKQRASREKRRTAWVKKHVALVLGEAEPLCVDTSCPSRSVTGRNLKECKPGSSATKCLQEIGIFPDSYPNFAFLRFSI